MEFSLRTGSRVGLRELSKLSCERKHLMTSSTLDDERSTTPLRSWRYFCVLKRVQGTSLTTMQMGSQIKQRPFTSYTLSSVNNAGSTRDFVVFVLAYWRNPNVKEHVWTQDHNVNLVVKHVDRRVIRRNEVTGQLVFSHDYSNTYYHPSCAHLRRKNPVFTGLVFISNELFAALEPGQRAVLEACDLNVVSK